MRENFNVTLIDIEGGYSFTQLWSVTREDALAYARERANRSLDSHDARPLHVYVFATRTKQLTWYKVRRSPLAGGYALVQQDGD